MLKERPPAVTASAQEGLESEGETGIRICQLLDYWIPCTFTSPGVSDLLGPMEMSAGSWISESEGKTKTKNGGACFLTGNSERNLPHPWMQDKSIHIFCTSSVVPGGDRDAPWRM